MAAVRLDAISKEYGGAGVINGLTLSVEDGELVWPLAPLAGADFEKAPGRLPVVRLHHAPWSASTAPLAFLARTCQ